MKIAAVQLNTGEDRLANISIATNYIDSAVKKGADFIVLPEYVDFLGEENDQLNLGEHIPGEMTALFAKKAKEHGVYLHCGSIREKSEGGTIYNSSILFDQNGEVIAKYRKIHLYDAVFEDRVLEKESTYITSGDEVVVAETEFGKVGLTICYDLRFPELFRSLALKGAKVIFVPAAFPSYTGANHWEVLLRARAIENQCYIVAAAQVGSAKPNRTLYGNSMIIDPWGTVVSRINEKEGIILYDIDMNYLEEVRKNLPCLSHRKPEAYTL